MSDQNGAQGAAPAPADPGLLESWKEIASYLNRDVRTVQRWEKREGLPVHRHLHAKSGSVYAFKGEIDEWWRSRRVVLEAQTTEPELAKPYQIFSSRSVAGVAAIVGVLIIAGVVWNGRPDITPRNPVRLVVLPFATLGGGPDQDYLSDGMTEEIIVQLSRLAPTQLGVISRGTASFYKGSKKRADEIGRELKVDYVLEGSVRRSGSLVRVSVQLTRVSDATNVWSDTYERELGDALALQRDVAVALAREVSVSVNTPLNARVTVNPDAYRQYLIGRYYWNRRGFQGVERAIAAFQEAIRIDPEYARAYAGLADCFALLGSTAQSGTLPPHEAMPRAKAAAEKALQLDPTLVDAHATLAYVHLAYDWDLDAAEREFERATALDPKYPSLHHYKALFFVAKKDARAAVEELKTALELDPLSLPMNTALAEAYYYDRKYDRAVEQAQKVVDLNPNFVLAYFNLGRAQVQRGNHQAASTALTTAKSMSRDTPGQVMALGFALARSGDRAGATEMLQLLESTSRQRYVPELYIAAVHTGLGDFNQAFSWLERAYAARAESLMYLEVEPMADLLRHDGRFAALMQRVREKKGQ